MTVRVRYYVLFWLYAGQKREECVELPDGSTLADLVETLAGRNGPGFAERVVEGREIHRFCWCLVNGRRMSGPALGHELRDQDEVVMTTPLVVGG